MLWGKVCILRRSEQHQRWETAFRKNVILIWAKFEQIFKFLLIILEYLPSFAFPLTLKLKCIYKTDKRVKRGTIYRSACNFWWLWDLTDQWGYLLNTNWWWQNNAIFKELSGVKFVWNPKWALHSVAFRALWGAILQLVFAFATFGSSHTLRAGCLLQSAPILCME